MKRSFIVASGILGVACFAHGVEYVPPSETVPLSGADGGTACVDSYGACLTSWRPACGEEVFAMARGRERWRAGEQMHGGIPIYWPWFVFEGPDGCRIHGITPYMVWSVKERAADRVVFALDDSEHTRKLWPHRFHAEMEYILGKTLVATFRVTNTDTNAYECTEGFHPYFRVGDVSKCIVTGTDGTRYFWKGEAEMGDRRIWTGDFPCGLVATGKPGYVFEENPFDKLHAHDLQDPVLGRTVSVAYEGCIKMVLWNSGPDFAKFGGSDDPDFGSRFVCIEGATLYRDRAYTLAPGETHALRLEVAVGAYGDCSSKASCGSREAR